MIRVHVATAPQKILFEHSPGLFISLYKAKYRLLLGVFFMFPVLRWQLNTVSYLEFL